jgi:hypothetical protein
MGVAGSVTPEGTCELKTELFFLRNPYTNFADETKTDETKTTSGTADE